MTTTLDRATIDDSELRAGDARFRGAALAPNLRQITALRTFAGGRGVSPATLSIAWLMAQGPDVVPIPGSRNAQRVRENVDAASFRPEADDVRRLDAVVPRSGWAGDRTSFAARDLVRTIG